MLHFGSSKGVRTIALVTRQTTWLTTLEGTEKEAIGLAISFNSVVQVFERLPGYANRSKGSFSARSEDGGLILELVCALVHAI